MKAITLTQPWATLVAMGAKQVETRSWSTAYRGQIAIHAAKGYPKEARELCETEPFKSILLPAPLMGLRGSHLAAENRTHHRRRHRRR